MLCLGKFLVAKKFIDKRGGGVSSFSVENLLSHGAEKFGRGNPLVFHSFRVSKKFMDKRGGGVSRFSVENFLSHSAEKFS